MGPMSVWWLVAAALSMSASAHRQIRDEYRCYDGDDSQYLYFGTKTAYEVMFNNASLPFQSQECSPPIMLWEMVRHGTRFPMFEEHRPLRQLAVLQSRIFRNHKIFKNVELCKADLDNLAGWEFELAISESNRLTEQGHRDMEGLAQRHRARYPQLFEQYSPGKFLFQVTESDRTNQSAHQFLQTLFPNDSIPQPEPNNPLLRSYMNCSTWMLDYASSRAIKQHLSEFRNSLLMSELVDRVSRRLGFFFDIRPSQVDAMYKMCAYDKAYKPNKTSAWCAAFTENELKILEYGEDLLYYYKQGPGMAINLKMACPLLRDLIIRLNDTVNRADNASEPVVIYFTHNGMFERFLSRLGLLNDSSPLTARYDFANTRAWRLAKYIPFAANLAVTLHNCSDGFKVAFALNERPLELSGCPGGVCDWSPLYRRFEPIVNLSSCNLDECFVACSPARVTLSLFTLLFVFITRFLAC